MNRVRIARSGIDLHTHLLLKSISKDLLYRVNRILGSNVRFICSEIEINLKAMITNNS